MTHEELINHLNSIAKYDKLSFYTLNQWRKNEFDKKQKSQYIEIFELLKSKTPPSEFDFLEIPFTASGDYINCCVGYMSNARILQNQFEDIITIYGSYSYETLFIQLYDLRQDKNEELLDIIEKLFLYPLLDEDDESKLVDELAENAWDNWIEYDFKNALAKYLSEELCDELTETCDLKSIFYEFMRITEENFISENNDVWIDVDDIVGKMYFKFNEDFWTIFYENKLPK